MSTMRMARATLRQPKPTEKVEQAHIVKLLRSIGGAVYVLGNHRRRGDYPGTMQTPGIPDLLAFLKRPFSTAPCLFSGTRRDQCTCDHCGAIRSNGSVLVFIECKASGGRLRVEQTEFRAQALDARVAHIVGGLDDVIAWLIDQGHLKREHVPHYRQPEERS